MCAMHAGVVSRVLDNSREGLLTPQHSPQHGCIRKNRSTKKKKPGAQQEYELRSNKGKGRGKGKSSRRSSTLKGKQKEDRDSKLLEEEEDMGNDDEEEESVVDLTIPIEFRRAFPPGPGIAPKALQERMSDIEVEVELTAEEEAEQRRLKYKEPSLGKKIEKLGVKFRLQLHARSCFLAVCVSLGLLAVLAGALLVVVGVLINKPYFHAESFIKDFCEGVTAVYSQSKMECSCGYNCTSVYPCVEVVAAFGRDDGKEYRSFLRESEVTLSAQCSFYPPCKTSSTENVEAVKRYANKYGTPGITYPCLYNPNNHAEVIRTRRFHLQHVVHGVVWSSVLLLVALALLLAAIVRRRRTGCAGL